MSKIKYIYLVCVNAHTTYDMDDEVIKIKQGKVVSAHTTRQDALKKAQDYYSTKMPSGLVHVVQKRVQYDDSK